jgi:hypothetical protein
MVRAEMEMVYIVFKVNGSPRIAWCRKWRPYRPVHTSFNVQQLSLPVSVLVASTKPSEGTGHE